MEKLIIWSFGTSDLKLDGKLIVQNDEFQKDEFMKDSRINFYKITEKINDDFEQYKNRISFDMLESFLENKVNDEKVIVKWIFTDQKWFFQDTKCLKEILKKYLKLKKIARYAREHIILSDARRPEEIKKTIDNELLKLNLKQDEFENIFIVPTWWTKWMVSWLVLSVLSNLDLLKIKIFYGEEHNNKTVWIEQDDIVYSQYKYTIKSLRKHEDYKAIIDFIKGYNLQDKFNKEYAIARYFYARLNADYETAEEIYIKNKLDSKLYISWEDKNLLEEAINGILYTWRTWKYIEFLWRVYNFTDIATNYIIKKYYNIDDNIKYSKLKNLSLEDKNLEKFLNNYKISLDNKLKSLQWDNEVYDYLKSYVNTKVLIAIVDYISTKEKKYKRYITFFNKINDLNEYRNKTIIWHGISPVSKQIIEKKYNWNIEEDFQNFFEDVFDKKQLWINFND